MNFMFSWQEQYLTRSLRSLVRYCSCHSNIKFISSRHRVIFSIYASSSGPRLSLFSEVSYCRWHWLMYMSGERHLWQQLCCWWNLKQKINVFGAYARVPPTYNQQWNCWDTMGQPQSTILPCPLLFWGVCCLIRVAWTAAQHCMEGVGSESFIFPFWCWQTSEAL